MTKMHIKVTNIHPGELGFSHIKINVNLQVASAAASIKIAPLS